MKKTLILCALLAACRSTAPAANAPVGGVEGPILAEQWLVWTGSDDGMVTNWITLTDGEIEVLGAADGVWIGVGDRAWEFDIETTPAMQSDCDCVFEAEQAGQDIKKCDKPAEFTTGVLRPFPTGPVIDLPAKNDIGTETQAIGVTMDGTAGPYAFITVCVEEYACGAAHGGGTCSQHIYDLRDGTEIDEYAMAVEPLRGAEMLSFVREAYDDELEAESLAEEDVVLSWVAPKYENSIVPRMEEQYTGPACYACSDGLWDSYTISTRRTVDALPGPITEWLDASPPPPAKYLGSLTKPIGGWSVVPPHAKLREHLAAAF